jgi:hypothetical protein
VSAQGPSATTAPSAWSTPRAVRSRQPCAVRLERRRVALHELAAERLEAAQVRLAETVRIEGADRLRPVDRAGEHRREEGLGSCSIRASSLRCSTPKSFAQPSASAKRRSRSRALRNTFIQPPRTTRSCAPLSATSASCSATQCSISFA